jgi:hypothetical protein
MCRSIACRIGEHADSPIDHQQPPPPCFNSCNEPRRLPRLCDCRVSSQLNENNASMVAVAEWSEQRRASRFAAPTLQWQGGRVVRTGASEPRRGTDRHPQTRHSIRSIPHMCININISNIGCNEPWRLPRLCDCRVSLQAVKQIR